MLVSQKLYQFLFLPVMCEGLIPHSFANIEGFQLKNKSPHLISMKWYLIILIAISLATCENSLFICSLPVSTSSSVTGPFLLFAWLSGLFFCFLSVMSGALELFVYFEQ